jgi:predicted ATPase
VITEIEIENYKSINKLRLELGRVNVFIGENGAGKSNVLEAIALAAAAAADKLDNEFLASRGIRVTGAHLMRAAFPGGDTGAPISVSIGCNGETVPFVLENDNGAYSKWVCEKSPSTELMKLMKFTIEHSESLRITSLDASSQMYDTIRYYPLFAYLKNFVIYSPENTSLRTFQREGQIEPLGINGEGLLKLLSVTSQQDASALTKIKSLMQLLGWFDDFQVRADSADGRLDINDRYLDQATPFFDHRSVNEGFFFLLFYFTLFSSKLTPPFFAVDNIDASLNPKLCEKLMLELVKLSKAHDKQVILTTHNPAVLDGLNLDDDEQRLFVISRDDDGATKIKRVNKPRAIDGARPVRLSELFLKGMLGGLPEGF